MIQGVSGSPLGTVELGSAGSHPHRQPSLRLPLHQIQIKVADFGLAKFVGQDTATTLPRTLTGDLMGTAAYMSPEQARGGSAKLDASTDVYSLGAILYELLTGRPPFVGVNPLEVLGQVVSEEPVRPSQLVRNVPRDLQTICLKCLERAPQGVIQRQPPCGRSPSIPDRSTHHRSSYQSMGTGVALVSKKTG